MYFYNEKKYDFVILLKSIDLIRGYVTVVVDFT